MTRMLSAARCAVVLPALVACAVEDAAPPLDQAPAAPRLLYEFVGRVDVEGGLLRLSEPDPGGAGSTRAKALTELPVDQNGAPDAGSLDTLELFSPSASVNNDGCGTSDRSFEGNVAINSFFDQALTDVYVQITSISPQGTRELCLDDPPPEGESAALGTLRYGAFAAGDSATRLWRFRIPSLDDFNFQGRVLGDVCQAGASAPVVISSSQSRTVALPGESVTFAFEADDPDGCPLTFAWGASTGALGTPVDAAETSTITWTAPTPYNATSATIDVVATDPGGQMVTHQFTVTLEPDLSVGLAGYWPLDGDGKDLSGNNRPLDLIGSPAFASGQFGSALSLSGTGDDFAQRPVVDAAFQFGTADFTLQAWVRYDDILGEQVILENLVGANGEGFTVTKLESQQWQFFASGTPLTSGIDALILPGSFLHVLVRRTSGTVEIFRGGSLVATGTISSIAASSNPLLVGRRNAADGRVFAHKGRIDDVAIWNRALSDAEIAFLTTNAVQ